MSLMNAYVCARFFAYLCLPSGPHRVEIECTYATVRPESYVEEVINAWSKGYTVGAALDHLAAVKDLHVLLRKMNVDAVQVVLIALDRAAVSRLEN